ncbi:type II secretion system protein GspK [Puniceicoccaceae bacterium K14]|nr:type II secretion system protein GspK [Puniceicoccaceae bacterium K14]
MRWSKSQSKTSPKRGSVILLILMLITVVSYLLIRFIERAGVEVQTEGYYTQRDNLRRDAWSMMEVAIAVLADVKEIEGSLYSPAQGWGNPLSYAEVEPPEGLQVSFNFIDESAKVGINQLDEASLFLLFDEMEFEPDESQELSDVLLDWIDEDDDARIDGAESRDYSTSELEMNPANAELESLEELKYLILFDELFFDENGDPNAKFRRLEQSLTVHEIESVNINAASDLALRSLVGLSETATENVREYLNGDDEIPNTADDNYFESADELASIAAGVDEGISVDFQISVLTIEVTVQQGGGSYTLIGTITTESTASVETSDGESNIEYPFLFLEIRERPGIDVL